MKISQLSIFLENKEGRLWNALDALANGGVNIRALSLADTSDFGILRIIVHDPEKAKKILEENDFIVKIIDVVGVELDDTPGGLANVLKLLNENNINLEYIYAFTHEKTEKAILLLQSKDLDILINVLENNNVNIVPSKEVYNL
ncbi:MAG: acetolactate synthase [Methanobrevibacter arboriphilus]|uniref:Acetolactate synthase n=1 Tax=Methanobrevibacter arboriphilus TaxID=39441 RepID=A0A843A9K2_METAZ|nr:ACT domain-containing protein [Methanobrevibacter arboriphilus]MBF4467987.1 acetolactate synthase [Methanobrevibacter arboriphilus]